MLVTPLSHTVLHRPHLYQLEQCVKACLAHDAAHTVQAVAVIRRELPELGLVKDVGAILVCEASCATAVMTVPGSMTSVDPDRT